MMLAVARTVRPRRSTRRPLVTSPDASAVIAWHREAAALETAKEQLMTPIGKATPKVKSEHLSDDDDILQKQIRAVVKRAVQAKQQGQWSKGAEAKEGGANLDRVVIFMMLAQLVLATGHGSSRDIKVGGP